MELWISPSTVRVLRIQLMMSGSEAVALTCRTILPVQNCGPYFQYFLSMCYHFYRILDGAEPGSTACYSQNNTKHFIFFQMVKIVYFGFHILKKIHILLFL